MVESNFNVTEQLAIHKEELREKLKSAISHAPFEDEVACDEEESSDQSFQLTVVDKDGFSFSAPQPNGPNTVFLAASESHLYPWLCREVYELGNVEDRTPELTSLHEFSHLAAALAAQKAEAQIGFQFYKDRSDPEYLCIDALVAVTGEITLEELEKIVTAPDDDMSTGDLLILQRFSRYFAQNSLAVWPTHPDFSITQQMLQ